MRAVQFDRIEAQALRVASGTGEGGDGVGHIGVAHGVAIGLAGHVNAGRAFGFLTLGRAAVGQAADMPQLRRDQPALTVDGFDHLAPAIERGTKEMRHIGIIGGAGALHRGAFGDDQAHAAGGALAVIFGNIRAGLAGRREAARHWRHHDAIGEGEALERERAEEGIAAHARFLAGPGAPSHLSI